MRRPPYDETSYIERQIGTTKFPFAAVREAFGEGWMKIIRVKEHIDAEQIEREVEDHGRAVAVLPYDPERHVIFARSTIACSGIAC